MNKSNKTILVALFLISLLDYFGLGVAFVVFSPLFLHLSGSTAILNPNDAYNLRLMWLSIALAIYPLGQFFGAGVWGQVSDFYGRKKILIFTLLGTIIGYIFSGIAISIASLSFLLFSRFFTGLCAGNIAVAQSSMSDLSTPENKASNLGLLWVGTASGWTLGPLIGGKLTDSHLVSWFGMAVPFWFAAVIGVVTLLYTVCFFRETVQSRGKTKFFVFTGVANIGSAIRSVQLRWVFILWIAYALSWTLFYQFFPPFLASQLNFGASRIGDVLAYQAATFIVTQLALVRMLSRRFAPRSILLWSLPLLALSMFAISISNNIKEILGLIFFYIVWMGFSLININALLSNSVSTNEQGKILGSASSVLALATIFTGFVGGPLMMIAKNLPLVIASVIALFSWIIIFFKMSEPSGSN